MKNIVVIGSTNTDMVVKASYLPAGGETVLGGEFLMNAGGKGANQAVAAARYGNRVVFVAKTGNDLFGERVRSSLREDDIVTDYVSIDPLHPSGVALITIDARAENCIVVASGANMYLSTADVDAAREEISAADVVLMQLESPIETVTYAARMAAEAGVKVVLNPAPAPDKPLPEAAKAILDRGPQSVIITLGGDGSLVYDGQEFTFIEATKVEAVDTTAAGDTFNGVLATMVAEGRSLKDAAREASLAAAISVTRMGAQPAAPTRAEVAAMVGR